MLFDLRGRRRRAVQVTYLTLAVLMGGGLVLFGIGGGGGSGGGDSGLEKRIDRQEAKLKTSPDNPAVLAELVRLNYQVAVSQTTSGSTTITEDGKDDLRQAGKYWERYVAATDGDPDPGLARCACWPRTPTTPRPTCCSCSTRRPPATPARRSWRPRRRSTWPPRSSASRSRRRPSNCKPPPPSNSDGFARLPFRAAASAEVQRTTPGRSVNFHIEDEAID